MLTASRLSGTITRAMQLATITLVMLMTTVTAWAQSMPTGSAEVTGGPCSIYVKGWAYDPDDPSVPIDIRVEVYSDEGCTELFDNPTFTADKTMTGIEGNHGFEKYILNGSLEKWVKVYAIDATGDAEVLLLDKTHVLIKKLMVGETMVDSDIMDNIFGGNIASFDNATNTLTLRNPGINWAYLFCPNNKGAIIEANFDLTIEGSFHITKEMVKYWKNTFGAHSVQAVKCSGSLTFDGDFTFLVDFLWARPETFEIIMPLVYAEGDITLRSGTLVAGGFRDYALQAGGALKVESGFTKLEMKGKGHDSVFEPYRAMKAQALTLPDNFFIVKPESGSFDESLQTIVESDASTPALHIIITTEDLAAEPAVLEDWSVDVSFHRLWLGETQVTSENMDDIFDDATPNSPASASFDPETQTLTLNNPKIIGTFKNAKICLDNDYDINNLTITGSYHMTEQDAYYGIRSEGSSLTLEGDFSFVNWANCITNNKNLTIRSGKLEGWAMSSFGIFLSDGILSIEDGVDYVDLTARNGVLVANSLSLPNNYAITTPTGGTFNDNRIIEQDGVTRANHVIIQDATYASPAPLRMSSLFCTQATIAWDAPTTEYIIEGSPDALVLSGDVDFQYKRINDTEWSSVVTLDNDVTSITLSHLTPEADYKCRAIAVYGDNMTGYASLIFTTPPLEQPTNLSSSDPTYHSATLSWETPISMETLTGYAYQYKLDSDAEWSDEIQTTSNSATIDGLPFNSSCNFRVKALYTIGASPYASIDFATKPLEKPTNLSVSNETDYSVTLSWEAPTSSFTIRGYAYQYKQESDEEWSAETQTTATSISIDNLLVNTNYNFRIKTLYSINENSIISSDESPYASFDFATAVVLPYEIGFEDGLDNWDNQYTLYDYSDDGYYSEINTQSKHSGDFGYQFSAVPGQMIISPKLPESESTMVSFYHKADREAVIVVYSSTTVKDRTGLVSKHLIDSDTGWKQTIIFFPEGTKYFAISLGTEALLYLDDITITSTKNPPVIQDFAITDVTALSANTSWTGNGNKFRINYMFF